MRMLDEDAMDKRFTLIRFNLKWAVDPSFSDAMY